MAHRAEALEQEQAASVTVHLADVEPFAGLAAACARFCQVLPREIWAALPPDANEALTQVQAILFHLEHSRPDPPTFPGG